MPLSFDTRAVSVGELLSGTNIFRLPSFQRPYSWPEEKVAQLFDDLSSAYVQSIGNGVDDGYFLGAMIVARQGSAAPYDLVDGQQRLASLSAIIAVLRDLLPNGPSKDQIQDHLVRQRNTLLGLPEAPRFSLRDLENDKFGRWVHTRGGTLGLPGDSDTEAEGNLLRGLHRVRADLGKVQPQYAERLARFILNHGNFILITAGNLHDGYKFFRSVNTLGEPLTDVDLARAELLGAPALSDAERVKLREAWEIAEDEMGLDELRSNVDTVASLVAPELVGRDLMPRLRTILISPEKLVSFRTKLGGFLTHYVNLSSGEARLRQGQHRNQSVGSLPLGVAGRGLAAGCTLVVGPRAQRPRDVQVLPSFGRSNAWHDDTGHNEIRTGKANEEDRNVRSRWVCSQQGSQRDLLKGK